ncbi:hypothetical protein CF8_3691 [Nocardioides sp. CF8]|uniref:DUF6351 family protein n=1 Tax=Nocardioides sp. CF8 TaxID=110319 RepID=UPI00032EDFB6|nr:DUF6351 family protein [Nocardioides sp. CF8]EON22508.1 hypothetical protein CF8_3691 [Nocardioides sp. CF8]
MTLALIRRTAAVLLTLVLGASLLSGSGPLVSPAAAVPSTVGSADPGRTAMRPPGKRKPRLRISVLSNRADLISAGDALVVVRLPRRVDPKKVVVTVGERRVTRAFKVRSDGRYWGLLKHLRLGRNVVKASAPRARSGRTVITNFPNGGPVFAGPQPGPYQCQPTARDAQCNQPARYSFLYKSTDPLKTGLSRYHPKNPPDDVATTTTDQGVTVPFVVRREDGFQDRDRYTILTLFRPGKAWKAWAPQAQWNHKVLATHGGGCGASYGPSHPNLHDFAGTLPASPVEDSYVTALAKGFAVLATALNNTGHNCNLAVEAESMMMARERLVERYGEVRYLIGSGCSGGSIAQHTIANSYPGIYQGLVTTCSYPDVFTAGAQFADYHLMRKYFEDPSRWSPGTVWLPTQMADVEGHISHLNAVAADEFLFKKAINPETPCLGTKDPVAGDPSTRFDSDINPAGVRCSILDIVMQLLGPRPKSVWSAQEKAAGHGFAGVPFANTGVQYGLNALNRGTITPEQFVDLNEKVGGIDVNADPTPGRIAGDPTSIARAYRTGLINEMNHLDEVAIINHGGPDPGVAHDYAHAWWTETRLERDQGHTDNRVMWFGPAPLIGDVEWSREAFLAMDGWLAAVEKDKRAIPLAQKIAADRPATVTDRCIGVCATDVTQLRLSTPRQEAGGDIANDVVACRLTPLDRSTYTSPLPFSDAQWARLQAVFPAGVCDWSKPGVGQGRAETWLGYGTATEVVYGGRPLRAAPARSGAGLMSRSFRELLRK